VGGQNFVVHCNPVQGRTGNKGGYICNENRIPAIIKFMFSKKAAKIEEIFTVDLTLCSKCQVDGEDFINFCGLLRKHKL
jgi:hypothetical protein